MTHMVIFETPDGTPGYHQADDLGDAVQFVEDLRNDQDVELARIFRMEEVPFEFRSYFRVEIDRASRPAPSMPSTGPYHGTALRRVDLISQSRIDLTDDVDDDLQLPGAGDDIAQAATRRGLFGR